MLMRAKQYLWVKCLIYLKIPRDIQYSAPYSPTHIKGLPVALYRWRPRTTPASALCADGTGRWSVYCRSWTEAAWPG